MRVSKTNNILYLTRAAVIAAVYVALTLLFAPISYGAIQVRISEALTILPLFMPEAIPGLTIGCFIANIFGGGIIPDMIFGSLATLIGAIGTYQLGRRGVPAWMATLPPIIANAVIIPFVLYFGYGLKGSSPAIIALHALTVGIGEVIACGIGGTVLAYILNKIPAIHSSRPR